jgi:hypothetical protein
MVRPFLSMMSWRNLVIVSCPHISEIDICLYYILLHVDVEFGRPLLCDIIKLFLLFKAFLVHKLSTSNIFDVLVL